MKIGILLTDELREIMQPQFVHNYAEMFTHLLAGQGFTFQVYDVHGACELPPDVHACDGYLITGSRHGVYEDHAWLPPLFDFIRRLHAARVPLLGVCFGHQAVAQALGGRVEKSDKGWGLGVHEWQLQAEVPWMQPHGSTLRLLCIHQDQIVQLPPDAVRLAGSDFCENAAFAIGSHIFCIQGHPEFSVEYVQALLDKVLVDKAPPESIAAAHKTLTQEIDLPLCAQWMGAFFKQTRVPPPDNPPSR